MRGTIVICGADWLKQNGGWVELYELSQVKVRTCGVRFFLDMTDHAGRTLSCDLVSLQRKPSIWDYVYNGIVHSVASGKASANKVAVGKLGLPLPAEFIDD